MAIVEADGQRLNVVVHIKRFGWLLRLARLLLLVLMWWLMMMMVVVRVWLRRCRLHVDLHLLAASLIKIGL